MLAPKAVMDSNDEGKGTEGEEGMKRGGLVRMFDVTYIFPKSQICSELFYLRCNTTQINHYSLQRFLCCQVTAS